MLNSVDNDFSDWGESNGYFGSVVSDSNAVGCREGVVEWFCKIEGVFLLSKPVQFVGDSDLEPLGKFGQIFSGLFGIDERPLHSVPLLIISFICLPE